MEELLHNGDGANGILIFLPHLLCVCVCVCVYVSILGLALVCSRRYSHGGGGENAERLSYGKSAIAPKAIPFELGPIWVLGTQEY